MFHIDKTSPEALYQQLKSQVRQAVDSGLWPPGEKLPSERELIDQLGISRITVRQAYRELVAEGYLTSAAGKGVYVAARAEAHELDALVSFTAAMRDSGVATSSRVLTCEIQHAGPAIAAAMLLEPSDEVVHLHRVRLANGVPVSVQQVWLPHVLVPGLADVDFATASLFDQLRGRYGLRTARAETIISARLLDEEEARSLELVAQAIGLTVDQYTYDPADRVIELSRSIHHPTRLPVRISQAVANQSGSASLLAHPHPTQPRG
jgi:GntR family transcriptional regulator